MAARAVWAWFGLLVLAFANATVREAWMIRRFGEATSHAISSITLALMILLAGGYILAWIGPQTMRQAWVVGTIWLALTLAFELLAGHYLFNRSWSALLADFNLAAGRLWLLVLAATLLTPVLAFIWHTAAVNGSAD